MNYTKEQQHFLSDLWTKESLKRLQLYQFNAGRRTLASGGCKRKELLRLLELIQEVKVFYKTFHWPIIEAFQMNCVVIFKTSFFDERLAGFALNLFCVEGSEYQKPVWLALCARCSSCVTKENRIHSRPHLFGFNCRDYACSTRTCCDKGKYWFDSNFRLTVSGF